MAQLESLKPNKTYIKQMKNGIGIKTVAPDGSEECILLITTKSTSKQIPLQGEELSSTTLKNGSHIYHTLYF